MYILGSVAPYSASGDTVIHSEPMSFRVCGPNGGGKQYKNYFQALNFKCKELRYP